MIRVADYPQLKGAAWYLDNDVIFTDEEALAFYEGNWKYIEQDNLIPEEQALIERLIAEVGKGVLNV